MSQHSSGELWEGVVAAESNGALGIFAGLQQIADGAVLCAALPGVGNGAGIARVQAGRSPGL